MKKWALGVLVLGILLGSPAAAEKGQEGEALDAATAWIALVDQGDYAKSWQEAAEAFKKGVTQEEWVNALTANRSPLGQAMSRKVATKESKTSPPGAPEGEYVGIKYETVFERRGTMNEEVTPMRDKDGKWRVSGYYIYTP
ncbi:MAG: DUF4019 domain-containing protein [Candidatus Omnitrophica bacterium]|nr:DUF4019 domain-containing protein [Candidatus Omnitrophota bacterium]